jgi:flagellar motor switch protein FliN/FliY
MTSHAAASVVPFRFAALEPLTRADVTTAARLRRVARELCDVDRFGAALGELTGARVALRVGRIRKLEAPRGADDAFGVVLAIAGERSSERRVLVEVEGALAASLAARALRQKPPRLVDASRSPSPAIAGALAALLVATARRAHAGVVLKVVAAGPGADLARDLLLAERNVTTAALTVFVDDDAFEARVTVPDAFAPAPRGLPLSQEALSAMGEASIALPLVLMTTLASRLDVSALAAGDVLVPTRSAALAACRADGAVLGAVALVAPSSERGLSADLAEGGQLVVRGLLENHPWIQERSMTSEATTTTTLEVLEDAPVVVRVELGSVEMKAREWAELAPGDVIALGRRVGDPAILRVGGVELARGELVQVDGEYGVRIVSRSSGGDGR